MYFPRNFSSSRPARKDGIVRPTPCQGPKISPHLFLRPLFDALSRARMAPNVCGAPVLVVFFYPSRPGRSGVSLSCRPRIRFGFHRRNTSLKADHLRGGSSSARSALVQIMLSTMLLVRRSQREPLRLKNVEQASVFVRPREAPSSSTSRR